MYVYHGSPPVSPPVQCVNCYYHNVQLVAPFPHVQGQAAQGQGVCPALFVYVEDHRVVDWGNLHHLASYLVLRVGLSLILLISIDRLPIN